MKRAGILLIFLSLTCSLGTNAASVENFTCDYDVNNWTLELNGGSGYIDTSGAPYSIVLVGNDDASFQTVDTDFTVTALHSGKVTFNWFYTTYDVDGAFADPFGYLINGTFIQLTDNDGGSFQSGSTSFYVNKNDVFGFRVRSQDSLLGAASTEISGFSAPHGRTPPQFSE